MWVENWWYEHTVFQKWREKPVQLNMVPEYEVLSFLPAELRGLSFPSFKLSDFQDPPPPLSIYIQNSSTPWPWTFNFKQTPHPSLSLQMITNEFKQNIIQRWLSYVIRSFLQVGFRFQYQLINRVWLSFDFFSFIWNLTVCFSVALYSCVWRCLKISQNIFYLYLFTFLVLILQSTCFIFKGWKRKQTMEEQPHRACEQTKSNLKQNQVMLQSSWPRLLLFDLARKQCNGI